MKTKITSVRSFLPLLAAGLALFLGVGCATQERFYSITQASDGKFYTPTGERRYPSSASVKVENTLDKDIEVFAREDRVITIVPAHQLRTVYVALDYYEQGFRAVLFARIVGDTMKGKELAKNDFRFANYSYDPVYGSGWGTPTPETKEWTIYEKDFLLRQDAPSPSRNGFGGHWFH